MESFIKKLEIRWADLDPNFHVLHSRYYDFGAYSRMCFFTEQGIDPVFMAAHNLGLVLFREECIFRKELKFGDELIVTMKLQKHTPDFSRWSIRHELFKQENILAAVIHVDGAWMDTKIRKLAIPDPQVQVLFNEAPKADDYQVYKLSK